ncbi:MAG: L-aspartate oxidase [Candidatus Eremiobacteraeota bacterium]|nr:L-aspartate oxidase [Candidatus Eremiobacteraeota bacterium]
MAALKLSPRAVTVLTKTRLGSGSATGWAQGGIAAAMGADDSPSLHSLDTRNAGAGISDETIVEVLTRDAPARIEELLQLGAAFDRSRDGGLALGREAAHRRKRIVHAGGDATGAEILKTLLAAVQRDPAITVLEEIIVDDVLTHEGRAYGLSAYAVGSGHPLHCHARAVIMATGGLAALYSRTTNPHGARGDGIAMAARAGAVVSDMEFVQFHPTALDVGLDPMPLVTEAVRGEGALLLNDRGERLVRELHRDGELAPRDVVARALFTQEEKGRQSFLDARGCVGAAFPQQFPTVFARCIAAGVDPRVDPIPVAPAAHYHMGGIAVDGWGRTSLPGLWACGEVSASGAHGANRLASNSLLEALVYACRVAQNLNQSLSADTAPERAKPPRIVSPPGSTDHDALRKLREAMYAHVGVVRSAVGLATAIAIFKDLLRASHQHDRELRNALTVATLVASAASDRRESRGSHYRSDFPRSNKIYAQRSFTTLKSVA